MKNIALFGLGVLTGIFIMKNPDFFKGWGKNNTPPTTDTGGKAGKTKQDYIDYLMKRGSFAAQDLQTKGIPELDQLAQQFQDYVKW